MTDETADKKKWCKGSVRVILKPHKPDESFIWTGEDDPPPMVIPEKMEQDAEAEGRANKK